MIRFREIKNSLNRIIPIFYHNNNNNLFYLTKLNYSIKSTRRTYSTTDTSTNNTLLNNTTTSTTTVPTPTSTLFTNFIKSANKDDQNRIINLKTQLAKLFVTQQDILVVNEFLVNVKENEIPQIFIALLGETYEMLKGTKSLVSTIKEMPTIYIQYSLNSGNYELAIKFHNLFIEWGFTTADWFYQILRSLLHRGKSKEFTDFLVENISHYPKYLQNVYIPHQLNSLHLLNNTSVKVILEKAHSSGLLSDGFMKFVILKSMEIESHKDLVYLFYEQFRICQFSKSTGVYKAVFRYMIQQKDTKLAMKVYQSMIVDKIKPFSSVYQELFEITSTLPSQQQLFKDLVSKFITSNHPDRMSVDYEIALSICYNHLKSISSSSTPKHKLIYQTLMEQMEKVTDKSLLVSINTMVINIYLHLDMYNLALEAYGRAIVQYKVPPRVELLVNFIFYHKLQSYKYFRVTQTTQENDEFIVFKYEPTVNSEKLPPQAKEEYRIELKKIRDHQQLYKYWMLERNNFQKRHFPNYMESMYQQSNAIFDLIYIECFKEKKESQTLSFLEPLKKKLQNFDNVLSTSLASPTVNYQALASHLQRNYISKMTIPYAMDFLRFISNFKNHEPNQYKEFFNGLPIQIKAMVSNPNFNLLHLEADLDSGLQQLNINDLDLFRNSERFYFSLLTSLSRLQRYDLAFDVFEKVIKNRIQLWPNSWIPLVLEMSKDRLSDSIVDMINQYLQEIPNSSDLDCLRQPLSNYTMSILNKQGKYQESLDFFRKLPLSYINEFSMVYALQSIIQLYPITETTPIEQSREFLKQWLSVYSQDVIQADEVNKTIFYGRHFYSNLIEILYKTSNRPDLIRELLNPTSQLYQETLIKKMDQKYFIYILNSAKSHREKLNYFKLLHNYHLPEILEQIKISNSIENDPIVTEMIANSKPLTTPDIKSLSQKSINILKEILDSINK
ncbi:RmlC-like cupin family protein [Tieghemostelium lacteum]|uniref:RmlC-like cupin family protein n=1 Tax=Tieghemostelium lacteum TaxID=361077 RepID=A0A152AAD6_TIELA|nr:RmlC-like cupin family protein [Tieghemostelium lacteum]|eukprot:KYR03037.1 RmlC-like cupin family protein [Tieghemostelium lacteum]